MGRVYILLPTTMKPVIKLHHPIHYTPAKYKFSNIKMAKIDDDKFSLKQYTINFFNLAR